MNNSSPYPLHPPISISSDCGRRDGFTLIELIVATAILAIIALAIMTMFTGSLRAVKQGTLAMDASEVASASIQIIERDLNTAFTARDAGEYHQFFGCPVGMMFIGLVRAKYASSNLQLQDSTVFDETLQLARVTYVLHPNEPAPDGSENDPKPTIDGDNVYLYSLIRLVEIGVEDLDTFPGVEWESGNPEYATINGELDAVRVLFSDRSQNEVDQLLAAKKRELWLRMLAGFEAGALPDPWPDVKVHSKRPKGLNPFDFVIADNVTPDPPELLPRVLYDVVPEPPDPFHLLPLDLLPLGGDLVYETPPDYIDQAFFSYGRMTDDPDRQEMTAYWNSVVNAALPTSPEYALGNPLSARLPEIVRIRFTFWFESPYIGAPDFERTYTQTIELPSAYTRAASWEPVISGYVRMAGDVGMPGVRMEGWPGTEPVTSASGYYSGRVPNGWSGTIAPFKIGYTFTPPYTDYPSVTSNQPNQNYIGM